MVFMIVASAFAVVLLNSLAFGLTVESVFDSLIHTFFIASSVSIAILYLAPRIVRLPAAKRVLILVAGIFVSAIIGLVLTKAFLSIFNDQGFNVFRLIPGRTTTIFSLLISYLFGFSAYFYLHSQNRLRRTKELLRQKELDEEKAKSLAIQAQLASLESKIHPHFLFNTLNSIAALVKEEPEKAEKMIEKLSALLRYSLEFEANKLVSVEEELKITRDYLDIESTRFAGRLVFDFDIAANLNDKKVPAFSVQTLVENSIKHVAAKHSAKTLVDISAKISDGIFEIEVSDNGDGFSEKDIKTGHGLDTLRKRLKNIFGNNANLEIIESGRVRLEFRI